MEALQPDPVGDAVGIVTSDGEQVRLHIGTQRNGTDQLAVGQLSTTSPRWANGGTHLYHADHDPDDPAIVRIPVSVGDRVRYPVRAAKPEIVDVSANGRYVAFYDQAVANPYLHRYDTFYESVDNLGGFPLNGDGGGFDPSGDYVAYNSQSGAVLAVGRESDSFDHEPMPFSQGTHVHEWDPCCGVLYLIDEGLGRWAMYSLDSFTVDWWECSASVEFPIGIRSDGSVVAHNSTLGLIVISFGERKRIKPEPSSDLRVEPNPLPALVGDSIAYVVTEDEKERVRFYDFESGQRTTLL